MRYLVLLMCLGASTATAATPEEIFDQRIMPIFKSPQPSSCVQRHLAGIDLKNYILPSSRDTFLSLRDQGLVDLDQPEQSKISGAHQDDRRKENTCRPDPRENTASGS